MNEMIHRIKKVHSAVPYKLTLEFNSGEIKELDLENRIREHSKSAKSLYKQLLDPEYFKSVKLDSEFEFVYWDNGLDFCPDAMHIWAVEQEKENKVEVSTK
ncbi:MAG: DUF2442 domain-containing protein [Bacteroidota bacterium]|jgi:hypothetical protein